MSTQKFKTGDRVKLLSNSDYYTQCLDRYGNPTDGVIIDSPVPGFPKWASVRWDNGHNNNYKFQDLKLLPEIEYEECTFEELEVGEVFKNIDGYYWIKMVDGHSLKDGKFDVGKPGYFQDNWKVQKVKNLNVFDVLQDIFQE